MHIQITMGSVKIEVCIQLPWDLLRYGFGLTVLKEMCL